MKRTLKENKMILALMLIMAIAVVSAFWIILVSGICIQPYCDSINTLSTVNLFVIEMDLMTAIIVCSLGGVAILALLILIIVLIRRANKKKKARANAESEIKDEATPIEEVNKEVEVAEEAIDESPTIVQEPELVSQEPEAEENEYGDAVVYVDDDDAKPIYDASEDELLITNIRGLNELADECREINNELNRLNDKRNYMIEKANSYGRSTAIVTDKDVQERVAVAINQISKLTKRYANKINLFKEKRARALKRLTEKRIVVSNYIVANEIPLSVVRDIEKNIMVEISLAKKLAGDGDALLLANTNVISSNIITTKNEIVDLESELNFHKEQLKDGKEDKINVLNTIIDIEDKIANAKATLSNLLCNIDDSITSKNLTEITDETRNEIELGSGIASRDIIFQSLRKNNSKNKI